MILYDKDGIIAQQAETIGRLTETNHKLELRIAELERRLALYSGNSSKPPSSDGLKKKPQKTKSLRRKGEMPSGGQKGHKGHTLQQVKNPDRITISAVHKCERCHADLSLQPAEKVIKRQVFDAPKPVMEVDEYQAEVKQCCCGCVNTGCFPDGVKAPAQYGPHIRTLAVYFSNQQLMPQDRLQQIFADIFGLDISTATLATIDSEFATKVGAVQEGVLEELKNASVKHFDETGVRVGKKTQWLHVISNDQGTHYRVSEKRNNLLEGVIGVCIHDHWKPYFTMEGVDHSLCNAHHLRELKALEEIEKEPWASKMARLLCLANHLKQVHKMDPPMVERIDKLYDHIVAEGLLFHEAQPPLDSKRRKRRVGHNLLIRLRDFKRSVLRFLTDLFVPFTNNQAEQDLRMMKVKQKISGCFRTVRGAETFCIIRGFISTTRKRELNIFDSIASAI